MSRGFSTSGDACSYLWYLHMGRVQAELASVDAYFFPPVYRSFSSIFTAAECRMSQYSMWDCHTKQSCGQRQDIFCFQRTQLATSLLNSCIFTTILIKWEPSIFNRFLALLVFYIMSIFSFSIVLPSLTWAAMTGLHAITKILQFNI